MNIKSLNSTKAVSGNFEVNMDMYNRGKDIEFLINRCRAWYLTYDLEISCNVLFWDNQELRINKKDVISVDVEYIDKYDIYVNVAKLFNGNKVYIRL